MEESIGILGIVLGLALLVVMVASMWKIFEKAGRPGWHCLIPFYNYWSLLEISGKKGGLMFLVLIPYVGGLIVNGIVSFNLNKAFGKDGGFGAGLFFLGFIFYPILGFGSAEYQLNKNTEEIGVSDEVIDA